MRERMGRLVLIAGLLVSVFAARGRAADETSVSSPDGAVRCRAFVQEGRLKYTVTFKGRPVVEPSALAVSAALRREPAGAAARVTRVSGRFTGMVPMPSHITVSGSSARPGASGRRRDFRARGADGATVLSDGRLGLAT